VPSACPPRRRGFAADSTGSSRFSLARWRPGGLARTAAPSGESSASSGGLERFSNSGSNSGPFWRQDGVPSRTWALRFGVWTVVGAGALFFFGTGEVPVTGRRAVRLVSHSVEKKFGRDTFDQVVEEARSKGQLLPPGSKHVRAVERVGRRIVGSMGSASPRVFSRWQDELKSIADEDWEFVVIDNPQPNAFVVPGGKVVVFTGILPLMQDETGMAVVLSHEIGHCVARHTAEKISYALVPILLSMLFGFPVLGASRLIVGGVHSRKLEREADEIGIHLLAAACYRPERAAELWKRFGKLEKNQPSGPAFLSSHPASDERERNLQHWAPDARIDFEASRCNEKLQAYQREIEKAKLRRAGLL
jgi:metalloendopeptidase OMA1, mitochondrial